MNSNMQKISIFWKISCFCLIFLLIATAASPAASLESDVSDQGEERQTDVMDVEVRVNPDKDVNCVKTMELGSTKIAVLGSAELDVEKILENSVKVSSVKSAGEVEPYAMEYRDIDSDGYKDLVMSLDCHELMTQLDLRKCFCREVPLNVRAVLEEDAGAKTIEGSDTTLILPRFR
ncbi:hypothetical protein EO98_15475 [Methanosarcina sp. 2.H.T.1A.6]|uniref:hypothetical protein n=1 Tax=unclassified Methanosarcina TaxID=2644672 RepID=UPI000621DF60|nr:MULTISPECIES: hypothetical protein [unclassified Methanosarcina]KKG15215.1 hypothetical protein EO94_06830 [Methanosarcina sp. 2.H.T.1A.3]KKG22900.1 hypothetical protein EO98_15475 [Methanosarcina sp. 2.H.T.1A.6]KKG24369.1 hypothetical protein EO96_14385 [Methanosarcina sp. 2.H.T.1A.8]KKG29144.1 hypothetical protein EO97_15610 [Methanosarcina sp. 2.H.T.1A.15]